MKKPGSDWFTTNFKYERLPSFCFICGLIGHIDKLCEKVFLLLESEIFRNWDASLRAPNYRVYALGGGGGGGGGGGVVGGCERWLREDDGDAIRGVLGFPSRWCQ